MTNLSRFRGSNRLFLIFAPSASDEGFGRQLDLIQAPYLFSRVDAMPMRRREMRG